MRLRVSLGDHVVGFLDGLPGRVTRFRLTPSYLRLASRPVVGRFYEDHLSPDFVDESNAGLPPFFQNYLPEPGSALRTLLAERAGVKPTRELELLAALGEDLPGALVVTPVESDDATSDEGESPPSRPRDATPSGPLRFSLAGMQLKFSVARGEKLTLPVTGVGGRFILKLPHTELRGVPRNEHATMHWAKLAGLDVPVVELVAWKDVENLPRELEFDEPEALLVERYDRPRRGGARVHQEDFAQVFGVRPEEKYGSLARVTYDRLGKVVAAVCGREDFDEFVRRLVFCVLSGNPDAHLKNWSLWYRDPMRPRLAPAYDLVSAAPYTRVERRLACTLAKEDEPEKIRVWHFGKLAAHAGEDESRTMAAASAFAARVREAWREARTAYDATTATRIEEHLSRMRLP